MEDFAALLEESLKKRKNIEPGSQHIAKITRKAKDFVFIQTIQEKIRGVVAAEEFVGLEKEVEPGAEIQVFFLEESSGDYLFTYCLQGDEITASRMELSITNDLPILGQVGANVNGGWEVKLGDHTGFCPASQFEPIYKGEDLQGKKFRFVVTDLDKKRILLSQRKIADKEKEARKEILKSEWKVGSFVTVTVSSIQKSGIQANLEGLSAFIPATEATYSRNVNLETQFNLGQTLKAKILELDWTSNRIILSVKDFLKDPWSLRLPFKEGDILEGTVDSIKPFGLFVKLTDEFHGLVPNRETGTTPKQSLATEFSPGKKVKVFVMEVNPEKRQISLSIGRAKDTEERMEFQKYLVSDEESHSTSSFGLLLKKSLEKK
ncbi:S1 RNA-binding domain-containing protein [Leptospira sp. GIMC2001]|uniref:S1 RNA-binding domain-containing protein n=1 Tax=Leptospira sp. GIMC2001 TaxID=1513297 RepID=UPI00234A6E95|nr:S1 RNA-binding domain-containing protein [Leptospira sp. GIMC2001]WCL50388.1 S1 RNA-binding domain-containing protein [Leptospira sp. GIMC2001]